MDGASACGRAVLRGSAFLADMSDTRSCPQCGAPIEDEMHAFWRCPWLKQSQIPAIQDSQHLAAKAEQDAPENPALWLRGLLPRLALEGDSAAEEACMAELRRAAR